ncbi:hypothetical protein CU669_11030 [Paramagnetospirillum kuznetsovii]|uniref:ABC transporter domain-containing protein n=1 Tax=Paramagnetospirillum kuznetsovii TaxID=2053833 RepID=A0A364NXM1_9PROT|nr:ABC transporter ATP-binding protein [Paramagnetospirillum kuznetsovii]RAU21832.1 hypothetical protein CU669_11030 [Paramagnetospirillum kuznetsovii]
MTGGRPAVIVEGLGKRYHIGVGEDPSDVAGGSLWRAVTNPFRRAKTTGADYWALKDVSFTLHEGEALGIIGRNGSGKSTLLKMLAGVVEPTVGMARLYGTIGSLLEVGTGFHPDLTGRENVFLNGSLLGIKRAEVMRQFDSIVDFAELAKFIDTPVKHYSSGMYVRLAFSVAIHLRTEILILDEVMAVGDAGFQKKCIEAMERILHDGRTVLFVSHSPWAIERFCDKALLLDQGAPLFYGSSGDASIHYRQLVYALPTDENASDASVEEKLTTHADLADRDNFERPRSYVIQAIALSRLDGGETAVFHTGEGMRVRIDYHNDGIEPDGYFALLFSEMTADRAMTIHSTHTGQALLVEGRGMIECIIPEIRLTSGYYSVMVDFGRFRDGVMETLDTVPDAIRIFVSVGSYVAGIGHNRNHGVFVQQSNWSIIEKYASPQ